MRRLPLCLAGGLLTLAVAGSAQPGHPEAPAPIGLSASGCDDLDLLEVARLAELELNRPVVTLSGPPAGPDALDARLHADCVGADLVLTLHPAGTSLRPLSWHLDRSRVEPEATARWLALVTAELVTEAASGEADDGEPEAVSARTGPPAPAAQRFELALQAAARTFFGASHQTFGGAIHLDWRLADHLSLRLDIGAQTGTEGLSVGDARLVTISGRVAVGLPWELGRWRLGVEAGWRVGGVWVSAETPPNELIRAHDVSGLWGGPVVEPFARLGLSDLLGLRLGAELGWTVWSVGGLVDHRREIDIDGPWLGLGLGLSARW